ncbi:MAG TPA: iron ABC transporter permease [Verrucomicrobiales bacterium]|jgi:iron complex transport system permease protein|nr:iron ABC transporter permease [Verrucomicrobiales bacterium]
MKSIHSTFLLIAGILLICISGYLSVSFGDLGWITPSEMLNILTIKISGNSPEDRTSSLHQVFWTVRLPRVFLAVIVGANLAVAGVLMQALFQNPLADPYVTGISSGAAFGAVTAMTLGFSQLIGMNGIAVCAFMGAGATTIVVYRISNHGGRRNAAYLLLTGIAVGGLMQALTAFLLLRNDPYNMRNILVWLMGSLAYRSWTYVWVLLPYSLLGLSSAFFLHRTLNLLSTGEESAHYLGLSLFRSRRILLLIATLLTAGSVAATGIIAFVGLIVPHILRILLGPDHRGLIPASMLLGPILLIWADMASRILVPGREIPIGIVTGVLGCLFFLGILKARKTESL